MRYPRRCEMKWEGIEKEMSKETELYEYIYSPSEAIGDDNRTI